MTTCVGAAQVTQVFDCHFTPCPGDMATDAVTQLILLAHAEREIWYIRDRFVSGHVGVYHVLTLTEKNVGLRCCVHVRFFMVSIGMPCNSFLCRMSIALASCPESLRALSLVTMIQLVLNVPSSASARIPELYRLVEEWKVRHKN